MDHVAVLAVDRDEALGLGHRHQRAQLALAGVAAHVHRLRPRVHDLGPPAVEVVDHLADRPFVARDRVGADHDGVVVGHLQPLVLPRRHERQRRHRLALGPRGDHAHLLGRVVVDVLDVDPHPVGDADDAEARAQLEVLAHRAPERRHLAPVRHGGVDDLLDAVHVAGEARHDQPLAGLRGEDPPQHDPDVRLGLGEARLLGVGRVGQQEPDPLPLGQLAHARQVHPAPVDGLQVDLEVARVQDHALGRVERQGHRLGHRVRHRDELDVAGAHAHALAVAHDDEARLLARPASSIRFRASPIVSSDP